MKNDEELSCMRCKHWGTNDFIQNKYGEGEGKCSVMDEITFCDKHNCILFCDRIDADNLYRTLIKQAEEGE